jgi:hypothetical protein
LPQMDDGRHAAGVDAVEHPVEGERRTSNIFDRGFAGGSRVADADGGGAALSQHLGEGRRKLLT